MSQSPKHLRFQAYACKGVCYSKQPGTGNWCEKDADHAGEHLTWSVFDGAQRWTSGPGRHVARRTSFLWPAAIYSHTGFEVGAL